MASGWRRVCRRGAGFYRAVHFHAAQRPLAGRPHQIGTRAGAGNDCAVRHVLHHAGPARGSGAHRGQGSGRIALGHIYRCRHHTHRPLHGCICALFPARLHRGSVAHRLCPVDAIDSGWAICAGDSRARRPVHLERRAAHLAAHRLRLCCFRSARVVVAGAARLLVHFPQNRHHRRAGNRRHIHIATAQDAGLHAVCRWLRARLVRQPVSLPVHYHRLRGGIRLSFSYIVRDDAQNDQERDAMPASSATAPCSWSPLWRSWPWLPLPPSSRACTSP